MQLHLGRLFGRAATTTSSSVVRPRPPFFTSYTPTSVATTTKSLQRSFAGDHSGGSSSSRSASSSSSSSSSSCENDTSNENVNNHTNSSNSNSNSNNTSMKQQHSQKQQQQIHSQPFPKVPNLELKPEDILFDAFFSQGRPLLEAAVSIHDRRYASVEHPATTKKQVSEEEAAEEDSPTIPGMRDRMFSLYQRHHNNGANAYSDLSPHMQPFNPPPAPAPSTLSASSNLMTGSNNENESVMEYDSSTSDHIAFLSPYLDAPKPSSMDNSNDFEISVNNGNDNTHGKTIFDADEEEEVEDLMNSSQPPRNSSVVAGRYLHSNLMSQKWSSEAEWERINRIFSNAQEKLQQGQETNDALSKNNKNSNNDLSTTSSNAPSTTTSSSFSSTSTSISTTSTDIETKNNALPTSLKVILRLGRQHRRRIGYQRLNNNNNHNDQVNAIVFMKPNESVFSNSTPKDDSDVFMKSLFESNSSLKSLEDAFDNNNKQTTTTSSSSSSSSSTPSWAVDAETFELSSKLLRRLLSSKSSSTVSYHSPPLSSKKDAGGIVAPLDRIVNMLYDGTNAKWNVEHVNQGTIKIERGSISLDSTRRKQHKRRTKSRFKKRLRKQRAMLKRQGHA